MTEAPIAIIRPLEDSDRPIVISSWVKNYGQHSTIGRSIDRRIYAREQARLVERLLGECDTWIAADPDAPEVVYGFICGEPSRPAVIPKPFTVPATLRPIETLMELGTVHYLWIREIWRRKGIARQLLGKIAPEAARGAPVFYTHIANTGMGAAVVKLAKEGIFNPYRLIERERREVEE